MTRAYVADAKLKKMAKPYGEDYLLVLYGGLRQAFTDR